MQGPTVIPLFDASVSKKAAEAALRVLQTSALASGPCVSQFEESFGGFIGNRNVVAVGEMSSAIEISLYMAGVRHGDEVVTSPMACLATTMPILNLSARVRWCDIDPHTGNIDPDDLRAKISGKTKAVLVFHWAGNPAPLREIYDICLEHGVAVVEDASEALGASYQGQSIGNNGADYTVFSFYPNRHLTTVEGAAIVLREPGQCDRARRLRRYGIDQKTFRCDDGEINPESDIFEGGWNSYMTNVAAAIGLAQLDQLEERINAYKSNGAFYDSYLRAIAGVTPLVRPQGSSSAYWVYSMLAEQRGKLLGGLKRCGIQASKVHLRNDIYTCFGRTGESLPGVKHFSERCISIPCGSWIKPHDRERIVESISNGW